MDLPLQSFKPDGVGYYLDITREKIYKCEYIYDSEDRKLYLYLDGSMKVSLGKSSIYYTYEEALAALKQYFEYKIKSYQDSVALSQERVEHYQKKLLLF